MVKRTLNRMSVLFLMLLGTLPQLALLTRTLELGADDRLWLWVLGAALCLWVSACFHRGLLLGMPAAALLLYRAYVFFDAAPITELDDLIDKLSGAYYTAYLAPNGAYSYLHAVEDHSFLLLLIAFLLLAYLSSGLTAQSGRRFLCFLGSVPLTALCLAINGMPDYAPVVAILLFWALILASGNFELDGSSGRLVFSLSLPMLLLLCAILWQNHPEDYNYDEEDIFLSQQFDRLGDWLRQWLEEESSESAPLGIPQTIEASPEAIEDEGDLLFWESDGGDMDLTQDCDPKLLESLFLRVTPSAGGTLYLRGVSYGDYLGTGWKSAPGAPASSLGFAASALRNAGETRRMRSQVVTPLRYAIVPYYCALSGSGDASLPFYHQETTLRYSVYAGSIEGLTSTASAEESYRAFAHEVYTRLPESTRTVMLNLAAEAGIDIHSPTLTDDVAAYIRSAGVYDLETEPYPSEDYAVWFLTQAHRGYCVHFATAATAMYRALGVPARITEGFLVTADGQRPTEVRGEHAHAWVEIYRDGLGWIPVEVTGQSGLNSRQEEAPEPTPPETESEAEAPDPEETELPVPVPSSAVTQAPLPVGIVQPEENAPAAPAAQKAFPWRTLGIVLALALLLSALPLWRALLRAVWKRRLQDPDPNRAVIAAYRRLEGAGRFGVSMPEEVRNCAEKAFFSARGVSPEEASRCLNLTEETLRQQDAALPLHRRFAYRFFYGLQ